MLAYSSKYYQQTKSLFSDLANKVMHVLKFNHTSVGSRGNWKEKMLIGFCLEVILLTSLTKETL